MGQDYYSEEVGNQADAPVDFYKEEVNNSLPHPENFLQRAIKANRLGSSPMTMAGMLPTSGEEAVDLGKSAINSTVNPTGDFGPLGVGASMTDPGGAKGFGNEMMRDKVNQSLQPTTDFGKGVNAQAKIAPLASLGLELGTAGIKGIANYLSTGELPKEIKGIEDLIHGNKSKALNHAFNGPQEIRGKIGAQFEEARSAYKDVLENHQGKFTTDDLKDVISKTVDGLKLRGREVLDPVERSLVNAESRFSTPELIAEEPTQSLRDPLTNTELAPYVAPKPNEPSQISDLRDIKNFKNQIFQALSSNKGAQGEFMKHYGDMLVANGAEDLSDASSMYSNAYSNLKNTRSIGRGNVGKIALGKDMAPDEIQALLDTEAKTGLGTNVVKRAKGIGEEGNNLRSSLQSKQNELEKIMGRQKTAKTLAKKSSWRIASLLGLEEAIRRGSKHSH